MPKQKKPKMPKPRNIAAVEAWKKKAGAHRSKGQRGSGRGAGKFGRHPKHKGKENGGTVLQWREFLREFGPAPRSWKALVGTRVRNEGTVSPTDLPIGNYQITDVEYEGPWPPRPVFHPTTWLLTLKDDDGSSYYVSGSDFLTLGRLGRPRATGLQNSGWVLGDPKHGPWRKMVRAGDFAISVVAGPDNASVPEALLPNPASYKAYEVAVLGDTSRVPSRVIQRFHHHLQQHSDEWLVFRRMTKDEIGALGQELSYLSARQNGFRGETHLAFRVQGGPEGKRALLQVYKLFQGLTGSAGIRTTTEGEDYAAVITVSGVFHQTVFDLLKTHAFLRASDGKVEFVGLYDTPRFGKYRRDRVPRRERAQASEWSPSPPRRASAKSSKPKAKDTLRERRAIRSMKGKANSNIALLLPGWESTRDWIRASEGLNDVIKAGQARRGEITPASEGLYVQLFDISPDFDEDLVTMLFSGPMAYANRRRR